MAAIFLFSAVRSHEPAHLSSFRNFGQPLRFSSISAHSSPPPIRRITCQASVTSAPPPALNGKGSMKLLNKAGVIPSIEPPHDESIRTLYVGALHARINEQDLRDNFYAHGEIESIQMVLQRSCAFVTYITREGAEKAAEELSNKLFIKVLRLKLMWGRQQVPKPDSEGSDEARQQAVAHSGLLPKSSHIPTTKPNSTATRRSR